MFRIILAAAMIGIFPTAVILRTVSDMAAALYLSVAGVSCILALWLFDRWAGKAATVVFHICLLPAAVFFSRIVSGSITGYPGLKSDQETLLAVLFIASSVGYLTVVMLSTVLSVRRFIKS